MKKDKVFFLICIIFVNVILIFNLINGITNKEMNVIHMSTVSLAKEPFLFWFVFVFQIIIILATIIMISSFYIDDIKKLFKKKK